MPRKRVSRLKPTSKPAKGTVGLAEGVTENERKEQLTVFLRDYDCHVQTMLKNIEAQKRAMLVLIQAHFKRQISALPSELANMTLKEFARAGGTFEQASAYKKEAGQESRQKKLAEILNMRWIAPVKEEHLEMITEEGSDEAAPSIKHIGTIKKIVSSQSNHGKKGKNAMPPPSTKTSNRTKAQFATPLGTKNGGIWGQTPMITPKFNPNLPSTPENIRDMKPGERLMSLAGSPVQVEGGNRRKAIGGDLNKNEIAHTWSDIAGVDLTPNRVEKMLRIVSENVNSK